MPVDAAYSKDLLTALNTYREKLKVISNNRKEDIRRIKGAIDKASNDVALLGSMKVLFEQFQTGWWLIATGNSRLKDSLDNYLKKEVVPNIISADGIGCETHLQQYKMALLELIAGYEEQNVAMSVRRRKDFADLKTIIETNYDTNQALKSALEQRMASMHTGWWIIATGHSRLRNNLNEVNKKYFPDMDNIQADCYEMNERRTTKEFSEILSAINRQEDLARLSMENYYFHQALAAKDEYGMTLLHYAILRRNAGNISWLINNGAEINAINDDGNTALHMAINTKLYTVIDDLLKAGARTNIINNNSESAYDLARSNKSLIGKFEKAANNMTEERNYITNWMNEFAVQQSPEPGLLPDSKRILALLKQSEVTYLENNLVSIIFKDDDQAESFQAELQKFDDHLDNSRNREIVFTKVKLNNEAKECRYTIKLTIYEYNALKDNNVITGALWKKAVLQSREDKAVTTTAFFRY